MSGREYRVQRWIWEETKKQKNMEEIIAHALPQIKDDAEPNNVEDDWISNFFDKCRLISDDEMQILWSNILAGEANTPGRYSKRTINLLGSLDKTDAQLFQKLCRFSWNLKGPIPLVFDLNDNIYSSYGINYTSLKRLDEAGFVDFSDFGYLIEKLGKQIFIEYFGSRIRLEFKNDINNQLKVGMVRLTKMGEEIAPICNSSPIPEFFDFIIEKWISMDNISISYVN